MVNSETTIAAVPAIDRAVAAPTPALMRGVTNASSAPSPSSHTRVSVEKYADTGALLDCWNAKASDAPPKITTATIPPTSRAWVDGRFTALLRATASSPDPSRSSGQTT